MLNKFKISVILSLTFLYIFSCQKNDSGIKIDEVNMQVSINDNLLKQKIYFGHMSVGYNVISGVEDRKKEQASLKELHVIEMSPGDTIESSGIYHSKIGKNGFPFVKCDNFKERLSKNDLGHKIDMAMFKFCYIDFNDQTDVDKLFEYYVETIDAIKKIFPEIKIAHITVPLRAHKWKLKGFVKILIKKDIRNIKRNEFNQLLHEKYSDRSIFDLAKAESTYPDGKREVFMDNENEYFALIKDYTYDGGHLNGLGAKIAANKLLSFLSAFMDTNNN